MPAYKPHRAAKIMALVKRLAPFISADLSNLPTARAVIIETATEYRWIGPWEDVTALTSWLTRELTRQAGKPPGKEFASDLATMKNQIAGTTSDGRPL